MEPKHPPLTYKFLVKPVFFIVSLLAAAYIVLKLETMTPEDVGINIPSYNTVGK